MSADISKMSQEVGLQENEFDYHRFLHEKDDGEIIDWQMTRLTFGITTSPYLATQVLMQLAQDYRQNYPTAAGIIESTVYVDYCLTGVDNIDQAIQIREELNTLLQKRYITLKKQRSSSQALLDTIPDELKEKSYLKITAAPGECLKALRLHWDNFTNSLHVFTPQIDRDKAAIRCM